MHKTAEMMIEILKGESEIEIEPEVVEALHPQMLLEDLGLDSLDMIEFMFRVGKNSGVTIGDDILLSDDIKTLADIADYIDRNRS